MKKSIPVFNIREAKAQLSKLVDQAARGESFIIAKGGKPLVQVNAIDAATPAPGRRFGFMQGQISVPEDFDEMGRSEIESIFNPA